ncbi:hypothetical protein GCM10010274_65490 [Streptomyces lavendofoliae]|uniref:Uncharacterized protein n=1 Tax=Streptomyces lavendofoliae TaxID=67314 RepID=A0A918M7D9_9ACTN|nr:hypothetical protein GCM10010274_65490 [Streptomyces lavendofoliae]
MLRNAEKLRDGFGAALVPADEVADLGAGGLRDRAGERALQGPIPRAPYRHRPTGSLAAGQGLPPIFWGWARERIRKPSFLYEREAPFTALPESGSRCAPTIQGTLCALEADPTEGGAAGGHAVRVATGPGWCGLRAAGSASI